MAGRSSGLTLPSGDGTVWGWDTGGELSQQEAEWISSGLTPSPV